MSLLWLTPICDPPVWVLRISNLGHYLFPSSAQGAPSEKTSQELRKLPDTSYLESQVWMSVCLSCFLSLSCLSCLSSWHLNLTFQVTCDWQLSQFLRFFKVVDDDIRIFFLVHFSIIIINIINQVFRWYQHPHNHHQDQDDTNNNIIQL